MIIKYRHRTEGAHVRVHVFTNGALLGVLNFRTEEWDVFKAWQQRAAVALSSGYEVFFIDEDDRP